MSVNWLSDRSGNAIAPRWNFSAGVKTTMDGTAKAFATLANLQDAYVLICNTGAVTVYVRADGTAAVSAAANCIPIAAGEKYELAVVGGLSIIGASGDVIVLPARRV